MKMDDEKLKLFTEKNTTIDNLTFDNTYLEQKNAQLSERLNTLVLKNQTYSNKYKVLISQLSRLEETLSKVKSSKGVVKEEPGQETKDRVSASTPTNRT